MLVNVFQRLGRGGRKQPAEVFNFKLFIGVAIFGILGAARGFDEGNVSGMLAASDFQKTFGLVKGQASDQHIAQTKGNISAMVQLFSIAGGLGACVMNDKIGRVWSLRALCAMWIIGVILQMTAYSLPHLYVGRAIAGIGIGATTVVGPVYLVEIAPQSIRGLCSGIFSGFVYLGIMLSYFATYGSQLHQTGRVRWLIPLSLQIMFAGISLMLSVFAVESPRYLMLRKKDDQAMTNLVKLRQLPSHHAYILAEVQAIAEGLELEQRTLAGKSFVARMLEVVKTSARWYRLVVIGLMIQILGQWSGANSLTIYAPEFFSLLGVSGENEKLFATAIFGVVKLVGSLLCAFFLIDRFGRRKSLYYGLGLQTLSVLYIAIFLAAAPSVASGTKDVSSTVHDASLVGIVCIYLNGFGWALGFNSIQYLIGTEIWPLHLRSIGSSFIMAFHFANQYGNSKSVPQMLLPRSEGGLGPAGTMFFFFAVCLLGLVYIFFFLPETAGLSLESLDMLFSMPWYKVGRYSRHFGPIDIRSSRESSRRSDGYTTSPDTKSGLNIQVMKERTIENSPLRAP